MNLFLLRLKDTWLLWLVAIAFSIFIIGYIFNYQWLPNAMGKSLSKGLWTYATTCFIALFSAIILHLIPEKIYFKTRVYGSAVMITLSMTGSFVAHYYKMDFFPFTQLTFAFIWASRGLGNFKLN